MDNCVPAEVINLAAQERALAVQIAAARQQFALRRSLFIAGGEFIPAAPMEAAISDGERLVDRLQIEQRRLLIGACVTCSNRNGCAAKMA